MEIKWPKHCLNCQFYDKFSTIGYCTYCYDTGKSRIVEQLGKDFKADLTDEETDKLSEKLAKECKHWKDRPLQKKKPKPTIVISKNTALTIREKMEEQKDEQRFELYNNGMSDNEIAKAVGVQAQTIYYWRRKKGLQANGESGDK